MISKYIVAILLIMNCLSGFSQVKTQKDSTNVYDKIEGYSEKRKTTKFLYKLVFRSTNKKPDNPRKQKPEQDLSEFEGKIIRKISIDSHDPFGFSFSDSTKTANNWLEKTGNFIHIRTKPYTIRDFLLIKENSQLDALSLSESERLLRTQNFIRSVEITVKNAETSSDSVDVFVNVLDSWSLIPTVSASTSKYKIQVTERNVFGWGHQYRAKVTNQLDDGKFGYDLRYTIPNFKNTFINTTIGYAIDLNGYYVKDFNIDRPFYSPLAKWAGGIYLNESYRQETFENDAMEISIQPLKSQAQDFWVGYAFKLFEGFSEKERTTQLITSARYLNLDYMESPNPEYDPVNFFSNEVFYLGSVGINSRQFIQDTYIFRDGIVEDVPVGTIFSGTGGVQYKNHSNRLYLGAQVSHGNYFKWGYLSTNFEFGTFFKNNHLEQTAFSIQANYYTNLISLGDRWKMRQFAKPQILIGTNRVNSVGDRVTLDDNNRFPGAYGSEYLRDNSAKIPGFDSGLWGTKKYVLALQTQLYSPWEVLGFRLNPYVNITSGMLGDEGTSITKSRLYSSFGIGFIVRNDYLVFGAFELSLSYYPTMPGQGDNIFKNNSFQTDDFGFQNFQIGKPRPIWYN